MEKSSYKHMHDIVLIRYCFSVTACLFISNFYNKLNSFLSFFCVEILRPRIQEYRYFEMDEEAKINRLEETILNNFCEDNWTISIIQKQL